jgi:hypothetical protein
MILGTLASVLLALPSPVEPLSSSDPWELRRAYLSCSAVEVDAEGVADEPLEKVLAAVSGRYLEAGQTLATGALGSAVPRVLLRSGAEFPTSFDASLERLGFTREGAGYRLVGHDFDRPEDGFVATFEDPDRAGLPVTIWYANSAEALEAYLTALGPCTRPGFRAFRGGELELTGALSSNGALRTADLVDRRKAWTGRFDSDRRIALRGFTCRVPEQFEPDRALAYLDVLAVARARALTWSDATGRAATAPVAAVRETRVVVHGHVEEMLELIGGARISVVNPVTGTVHVLLADGLPDDGGAAVAESAVRRLLGPPADSWLGPAAGVSAAGSWWGRPLEPFGARLLAAGVVPDLAELVAPESGVFLSPHVRYPMLGILFEFLAEKHGHGYLRELWSGAAKLDPEAEEADWLAHLAGLVPGARRSRDAFAARSWRAGCLLVPGAVGYGSRAVGTSLDRLAGLGADALTLRSFVWRDAPEPEFPGELHPPEVAARESDLEIASAAAAARARHFELGLDMHLLASSQGGKTADLSMPDLAHAEAFFDDYEPFLVHEALLAELIGAERFSIGTGLANATEPSRVAGQAELKGARWKELIATARALFDGSVTYTAGSIHEAERLVFADALDVLAIELFPALEGGPTAPDRGPGQAPVVRRRARRFAGHFDGAALLDE